MKSMDALARPLQILLLLLQLAAAILLIYLYRIEGQAFMQLSVVVGCGFAVNLFLPDAWRLPWFVLLSLAGVFVVFSVGDAAWLIGSGALLIGLCHVPVGFHWRVPLLLAAGSLLVLSRSGVLSAPWSSAVWPILGSMFMFRLLLYVRAVRLGEARGGWWGALAYFFMLPNLVFPLFPVVDYHAFQRTRYDKHDIAIYQQGVLWIVRGLTHLLLYRLVYQVFLNDPAEVETLGDLVQYLLGTILLYLRVSGSFHLVVGILHLFGFRLPETHRLYYLAHDFTELWRRINIYWKDFMTKIVFYPVYFRVKHLGPRKSLALATAAVFVSTWLLHSYQWFWLRGGFPLALPDALFWGILGLFVIRGALAEARPDPGRRLQGGKWNIRRGMRVAGTFAVFCLLWSLWSTDSVVAWLWLLGAGANIDARGILLLLLTFTTLVFFGSRQSPQPTGQSRTWRGLPVKPAVVSAAGLLALLVVSSPALPERVPHAVGVALRSLKITGLNERDAALQHRGYYEQLNVRSSLQSRVLDLAAARPAGWTEFSATGLIRKRDDLILRELHPSRSVNWNGRQFSTNQWGMRDRDYSLAKPAGVLRIALLGPSHVMGNGVADGETFEALVEQRLNADQPLGARTRFEVLNFGVDGFSVAEQVEFLEARAAQFDPDVAVITSHRRDLVVMEQYLLKLVWRERRIPHQPIRALLTEAGLQPIDRGRLPIPFGWLREAAKNVGLSTRTPASEAEFKVRRVAGPAYDWWIGYFAERSRARGILPLALALNAVVDDPSPEIQRRAAYEQAGVPVINLLDLFAESERPRLRVGTWDDHPNAAGHRVIADALYPQLVEQLQKEFLTQ